MIEILLLVLLVITGVSIAAAVHYRAAAKAAGAFAATTNALNGLTSGMRNEMEIMSGGVRTLIDHKFDAMGKWLTSELAKHATPAISVMPTAVPEGALAPISDNDAAQMLKMMEAAIAGLAEKKAKLEGALKAKQQADNALREVVVGE